METNDPERRRDLRVPWDSDVIRNTRASVFGIYTRTISNNAQMTCPEPFETTEFIINTMIN